MHTLVSVIMRAWNDEGLKMNSHPPLQHTDTEGNSPPDEQIITFQNPSRCLILIFLATEYNGTSHLNSTTLEE